MTSDSRAVAGPTDLLRSAADRAMLLAGATTATWVSALLEGLERTRAVLPPWTPSGTGR